MAWHRSNVVWFGSRRRFRRRRTRSNGGARHFRSSRRKRTPLAAPLLILALAFFGWAAFAPQAPAIAGAVWSSVANFVTTGDWVPPIVPQSVASSSSDGPLTGRARIIDADTLEIGGERIRLLMIDAPESGQRCYVDGSPQRCGERASDALADWIDGRAVICVGSDRDRYDRLLARCAVDGADMGAWLVKNGHAIAYRRYGTRYICDEKRAADQNLGIWGTVFIAPETWRQLPDDQQDDPPSGRYNPGWPDACS
jgi:endonuclease YncB( thermonuclease family)